MKVFNIRGLVLLKHFVKIYLKATPVPPNQSLLPLDTTLNHPLPSPTLFASLDQPSPRFIYPHTYAANHTTLNRSCLNTSFPIPSLSLFFFYFVLFTPCGYLGRASLVSAAKQAERDITSRYLRPPSHQDHQNLTVHSSKLNKHFGQFPSNSLNSISQ